MRDMDNINPLTMRIEDISKLPEDIDVVDGSRRWMSGTEGLSTEVSQKELKIIESKEKLMQDVRDLLEDKMSHKETDQLLDELFTEKFEQDTWLNQYQRPQKASGLYDAYKIKDVFGTGWGQ